MSLNKISVFTDGSCLNNGKKNSVGAIGIFFSDNDPDNIGQAIDNEGNKITNQTMELLACIQAFKIIADKNKTTPFNTVYVYTDSTYLINSMTKWYSGWEANGWKNSKNKEVENKDLIQLLYGLKSKFITIFKHIRSHQDEPTDKNSDKYKIWYGNYMADKLATNASKQYMEEKEAEKLNELNNINHDSDNSDPELEKQINQTIVSKAKANRKTNKLKAKQNLNV
jgi:ribonuclease HI